MDAHYDDRIWGYAIRAAEEMRDAKVGGQHPNVLTIGMLTTGSLDQRSGIVSTPPAGVVRLEGSKPSSPSSYAGHAPLYRVGHSDHPMDRGVGQEGSSTLSFHM